MNKGIKRMLLREYKSGGRRRMRMELLANEEYEMGELTYMKQKGYRRL